MVLRYVVFMAVVNSGEEGSTKEEKKFQHLMEALDFIDKEDLAS